MSTRTTPAPRKRIDPTQWDRLKVILNDALQQPSVAARSAAVRSHCAQDALLLREAESLLAEAQLLQSDPTDWLEGAADKATRTFWDDDLSREGQRLGAYLVVRQMGRGGMGTVYLAERADGEFQKQVAIKVLKRGTDTEEVLGRFKIERQIVARLEHPNIARLLDAGTTPDGLPYFVMENVAGVPVTQFIRQEELSIAARLELFLKICGAVEVAHQAGVVHRDLKPGNILIPADGEPKLLDFGIAKVLATEEDGENETAAGPQRFSPESAAPEQVRGESVTLATDVYALGGLLYEMLTGRTPHRFPAPRPSRAEVVRIVCEREIVPPSRLVAEVVLRRRLQGDLDRIVVHAMRKEPGQRYPSVSELAADIRRHLRGELIEARPATLAYRVQRFVRSTQLLRPRSLAAAMVLLVLGALLATLLFSGQTVRQAFLPSAPESQAASVPKKSIAVLPFKNLTAQQENGFFAEGVQDAILTDLTKIADLKVINRTSTQQYAYDAPRDLKRISRQLGVAYLLQGSVQRANNRVRVSVTLTDARTNVQTWAELYDRDLADVFAIQTEIARAIVSQLEATLSPSEQATGQFYVTRDMRAYDLYLQAKESDRAVAQNISMIDAEVRLLNEALARDPKYVPALCLLTRAHAKAHFLDYDRSVRRVELGGEALNKALRLAPNSGEVRLAEAIFRYWGERDYAGALAKLREAQLDLPNDSAVLFYMGLVERRRGEMEFSVEHMAQAATLDPFNATIQMELAVQYNALRRYDEARRLLDAALLWNHDYFFEYTRAMVECTARGDLGRARELMANESIRRANPREISDLRLDIALVSRDYATAEKELTNFVSPEPHGQYFFTPVSLNEGIIQKGLGNSIRAEEAFLRARAEVEPLLAADPNDGKSLIVLAEIDSRLGRRELAREEGERAARILPVISDAVLGPELLYRLAANYVREGNTPRALALLEQSARLPFGVTYGHLLLSEDWDPLRDNLLFQQLLDMLAPKNRAL